MPDLPDVTDRGRSVGGAVIADEAGTMLAARPASAGPGHVTADVEIGRTTPLEPIPDSFWLHHRGPMPAVVWHTQRLAGRRWYRRHVRGRPASGLSEAAATAPRSARTSPAHAGRA